MKLDVAVNKTELTNVGEASEFLIRQSAKAFKILSDGLYSNKIRAIIRELSCNAYDSHVAAGKKDVKFDVHLPSMLEPWFYVRDYGLGLDDEEIKQIYTTYFESTKTDSNDFVGALGLGSKSPFSYTENFTVTAIKDGYCRIYSAYINEQGIPSLVHMSTELTDEGNGVEVKFSVTNNHDYYRFKQEAVKVFSWFDDCPNIIGGDPNAVYKITYHAENIVPGVHLQNKGSGAIALMGNIPYPIDDISSSSTLFGDLSHLLKLPLVIEFEIGELDFAASREELSIIPLTVNSIKKKLQLLSDNLVGHVGKQVDEVEGEWNKALLLYTLQTSYLYKDAVPAYAIKVGFDLYDPSKYNGHAEFMLTDADVEDAGLSMAMFNVSGGKASHVGKHVYYENNIRNEVWRVPVAENVVFVLNDLKIGHVNRAKHHFRNKGRFSQVVCISCKHENMSVRQRKYNKLLKTLHNPPTVMKASELDKIERKTPVKTNGLMLLKEWGYRYGHRTTSEWTKFDGEIDPNTTYYYVCLNNTTPETLGGEEIDVTTIYRRLKESGLPLFDIIGVRKSRINEIKKFKNFVWFEDKIRELIADITDEYIDNAIMSDMLDDIKGLTYNATEVSKLLEPTSPYVEFINLARSIKKVSGNMSTLIMLCYAYGSRSRAETIANKKENTTPLLQTRYRLLKHFRYADAEEIAEYIRLVDNQR